MLVSNTLVVTAVLHQLNLSFLKHGEHIIGTDLHSKKKW